MPSKRADYGIDAPGVIRNLLAIGFICGAIGIVTYFVKHLEYKDLIRAIVFITAAICILFGLLMLSYSSNGKFKHRDRMINMISWTGHEKVLDIGTGRGLLMIAAAKKLEDSISVGIDIWNNKDLSDNDIERTRVNVLRESVSHKTVIKNDDARKISFADNHFDVVLSNLCLHNIPDQNGRKKACKEIARVLKSGGTGIISDFKHIPEYKRAFQKAGLKVSIEGKYWFDTFPPLTILKIEKKSA